jgi:TPP-dependent indolepyruvate ferredoxin oxidoreductase alpha subunit
MKNNKGISPSEAAAALGSIRTPKKAASSAANVARTQFKEKPLEELAACTCGGCPDNPKTTCPRGLVIRRRQARQQMRQQAASTSNGAAKP